MRGEKNVSAHHEGEASRPPKGGTKKKEMGCHGIPKKRYEGRAPLSRNKKRKCNLLIGATKKADGGTKEGKRKGKKKKDKRLTGVKNHGKKQQKGGGGSKKEWLKTTKLLVKGPGCLPFA